MDFGGLHRLFTDFLPAGWEWIAFAVAGFLLSFAVINVMIGLTAVYTWFERRALGRFQTRLGPNRWGPFGLFQPLADVLKLITKEDVIPAVADKIAFTLAPIVLLVPGFLVVAVLPVGAESFLGELNVGILFVIGVTGVSTLAIFMGAWGSRNKYAMFGALRAVAMLISYEVPMALALTGVVITAGSLALLDIVTEQAVPFALVQPLGFIIFVTAALAEMNRTPFDLVEGESELGGGYITEFSGMKFGIFQLAEFMAPIVVSALATVLFLAGTKGWAPVPGLVWFALKAFLVLFFLLWVRATWPRLRIDQVMAFAWKGLLPLALLNMFMVALQVQLLQDPTTGELTSGDLWRMAAFNWPLAIGSIVVAANVLGQRRISRRPAAPSPLANMTAEGD